MIPKKVHYIWLGRGQKSNLSHICINSWKEKLSEYEICEWNEDNLDLDAIASENRFFAECRKRKLWAYMTDYIRLLVLYREGGIYLDTDVQVLKSFDPLLEHSCFFGKEAKEYIGTGMIACEPGNSVIKKVLDFYQDDIWESPLFTIPSIITHILNNTDLADTVAVYPMEYFAPYDPWKPYDENCITKNTYCVHWFQANWIDNPGLRRFLSVKHIKNPIVKSAKIVKSEIGAIFRRLKLR